MRIFILLFFVVCVGAANAASQQAEFILNQNNPNKTFSATIVLPNNQHHKRSNLQIAFNFNRTITKVDEGVITKHVGNFYIISLQDKSTLHIEGKGAIKHITDAPSGYFYIVNHPLKTIPLASRADLSKVAYQIVDNQKTMPCLENLTLAQSAQSFMVPLPVELKSASGSFVLNNKTHIMIDKEAKLASHAAHFLANSIRASSGFILHPTTSKATQNAIIFTLEKNNQQLGDEGYLLDVNVNQIVIRATSDAGFFYAVQTLRQLLPVVPALAIRDFPQFHYRGLLLDVSRHFMPPQQIKRIIDLMALYKLNTLQLHLTDDEGWRIEIKHYPALTTIGAWRGFNEPLEPQYGSGAKRYGGYYTQNEMKDIISYAHDRHITIIPEIDLPGHARALVKSLPGQLTDPRDASSYTSVQGYHDNVLSPCREEAYTVIENILAEIAALFPSNIIHLGADEIPNKAWTQSPQCQQWMKQFNLTTTQELKDYFLKRIQDYLKTKDKTLAVWNDGIHNDDQFDRSTMIYAWTDEKAGLHAAEQGHPVVLMPSSYLYFDLAYNTDPLEPGFYWAGTIDTNKVYSYQPVTLQHHIQGIQGALWSENIDSQKIADYMLFPRLLALAEIAWTPRERQCWDNFLMRINQRQTKLLHDYGVAYRAKGL